MKKVIFLLTLFCTSFHLLEAQRVGFPSNFFNTNSQPRLLTHVQSNQPSDLGNFSKQWIGIGQPLAGLYGFRVQSNNNTGILALTGTGTNKTLELNWGGPGKTAPFEINQVTSFTNPNGKINRLTIRTNGNVGVGTSFPGSRLDVRTNSSNTIAQFIQSASSGRDARVVVKGSRNNCVGCDIAYIDLQNYDSNQGSGGSNYTLARVSAGMETSSGNNGYLRFYTTTSSTPIERMRIKSNGNVGIGRTNPAYKLDVNGPARVTALYSGSDKRFKEDVKNIEHAMSKINALDGLSYKFKAEQFGENDFSEVKKEKQLGFLAQDLQKVFPELVREEEDGYLAVNYIGLIPVLVEGLKEQQGVIVEQTAVVEEQTAVISKQEQEITELKSRMEKIEALLSNSLPNTSTGAESKITIPSENTLAEGVVLQQNVPNPASETTMIEYQLPEDLTAASLVIYDMNGRTLSTNFVSGNGTFEFNTKGLSNGTYIYAIVAAGKNIATQKMVIQK